MRRHTYQAALCFAACAWIFVPLGCAENGGGTQNESTSGTDAADVTNTESADSSRGDSGQSSFVEGAHGNGIPPEDSGQPPAPVNQVIPLGAEEPLSDPVMPHVIMSETHAATCLVNVGDVMPDFALEDIDGNERSLAEAAGEKLTVIFLWSGQNVETRNALEDLEFDISAVRAEQGVHVVGINVGDAAEKVSSLLEEAEVKFTSLLDPDGKYFAQLATGLLPRVYVLNADRTIAWFDLEYSNSTRRQLLEAVRFMIDGSGDASDAGSQ